MIQIIEHVSFSHKPLELKRHSSQLCRLPLWLEGNIFLCSEILLQCSQYSVPTHISCAFDRASTSDCRNMSSLKSQGSLLKFLCKWNPREEPAGFPRHNWSLLSKRLWRRQNLQRLVCMNNVNHQGDVCAQWKVTVSCLPCIQSVQRAFRSNVFQSTSTKLFFS